MNTQTLALDRVVLDGRMSPDWPPALRAADPAIDRKVERAMSRLTRFGPYIPKSTRVWRAYEMPPGNVRVVIVGQDPYPDPNLATGLAFSTGPNGPISDSLRNIFEELRTAVSSIPTSGDLSPWVDEGVFLLNRALTLPDTSAIGPRVHFGVWTPLLRATLRAIAAEGVNRPIAALLWGGGARRLGPNLEPNVRVFESSHPSPKSATYRDGTIDPFTGSKPFTRVNEWLTEQDPPARPIDWELVAASTLPLTNP